MEKYETNDKEILKTVEDAEKEIFEYIEKKNKELSSEDNK